MPSSRLGGRRICRRVDLAQTVLVPDRATARKALRKEDRPSAVVLSLAANSI